MEKIPTTRDSPGCTSAAQPWDNEGAAELSGLNALVTDKPLKLPHFYSPVSMRPQKKPNAYPSPILKLTAEGQGQHSTDHGLWLWVCATCRNSGIQASKLLLPA